MVSGSGSLVSNSDEESKLFEPILERFAPYTKLFMEKEWEFEIKQGMHEKTVNEKYGQPILVEKLKSGFLPIPKRKALYKIDDADYMILRFFSGRVHEVSILEDMDINEATEMFKKN